MEYLLEVSNRFVSIVFVQLLYPKTYHLFTGRAELQQLFYSVGWQYLNPIWAMLYLSTHVKLSTQDLGKTRATKKFLLDPALVALCAHCMCEMRSCINPGTNSGKFKNVT